VGASASPPTARELCERCGDLLAEAEAVWVEGARFCRGCFAQGGVERRDLRLESEIRFLGFALILGAILFLGFPLLATFLTLAVMVVEGIAGPADYVGVILATVVFLAAGIFCALVATSLRALRRWARIAAGVLCLVGVGFWVWIAALRGPVLLVLPGIFLGLVLGVVLLTPRVSRLTTPAYRALVALQPRRRRPVSWLALVMIAGLVILTLYLVVSLL